MRLTNGAMGLLWPDIEPFICHVALEIETCVVLQMHSCVSFTVLNHRSSASLSGKAILCNLGDCHLARICSHIFDNRTMFGSLSMPNNHHNTSALLLMSLFN